MADLFTGASRYSADFSAVIERSVGIWSLPLTQMQQQRLKSSDTVAALRTVQDKVSALQGTLQSVENSLGLSAFQTTSSDTSVLTVTSAEGVGEGEYTLRVLSVGVFATAVSAETATTPATGDFASTDTLILKTYTYDESDPNALPVEISRTVNLNKGRTLQGVVDAIKEQHGDLVQAAVVNTDGGTPEYALSLQSTMLGKVGFELLDGTDDLFDGVAKSFDDSNGNIGKYKVNGLEVKTPTRSITIAPNLTAQLVKADENRDITVSVKRGTAAFITAITSFVDAFNAAADEVDKQTGGGGILAGNALAGSVRKALQTAAGASLSGGGALTSLAMIGIEFTKEGRLQLVRGDITETVQTTFDAALKSYGFAAVKELIGSVKVGGALKHINDTLSALKTTSASGISTGALTDSIASLEESLRAEDNRIAAEQLRIEERTKDLQARIAAADAAIAALEQQANYFNSMFEAMRANQRSYS